MTENSEAILNLAPKYYTDPSIFADERRRIFSTSWQLICASNYLEVPGSCYSTPLGGVGVIFVCGTDGIIRGFRNACRHRGAQLLAEGRSTCQQIVCPYHGWRYDGHGQLCETPWFGEPSPFKLSELSLEPVYVEVWRGLVFAAIAPIEPLIAQLGDLPDELSNTAIEGFRSVATQQFEAEVNWKAYFDQFVENYHVPTVHSPDKSVEIWKYTVTDRKNVVILAAPAKGMYFGGRWIWGRPNWTMTLFAGGAKLSRIEPTSPEGFTIYYHYLFEDLSEGSEPARRRVIEATEAIFRDDIAASARAQLNYTSGNYTPGPMHPGLENGVAYFQRCVREALNVL